MEENDDQNIDNEPKPKPQLKVLAQVPEEEADPQHDKSQGTPPAVEEKKSLKKLGTAPAIAVNTPTSRPRPSIGPSKSQAAPVSKIKKGATGKAALEAMGVKFKKKGDTDGGKDSAASGKPAPKQPAPKKPAPRPPAPKKTPSTSAESKNEEKTQDGVFREIDEELLKSKNKDEDAPLSMKTVIVPLNFSKPPSTLTYTAFGIWCAILTIIVVLSIVKIVAL